jgi:hypothetical protein
MSLAVVSTCELKWDGKASWRIEDVIWLVREVTLLVAWNQILVRHLLSQVLLGYG